MVPKAFHGTEPHQVTSCLSSFVFSSVTVPACSGMAVSMLASPSPAAFAMAVACSGALVLAGTLSFPSLASHCAARHRSLEEASNAAEEHCLKLATWPFQCICRQGEAAG